MSVSRTAYALGFAGLLPQIAALALILIGRRGTDDLAWLPMIAGYVLAMVYGGLILSFLGGIWWGHAIRRAGRQAPLLLAAIVPSLVALAAILAAVAAMPGRALAIWPPIVLGSAILLTLLVDRHLVAKGEAPADWMRLRVPLSLGLGTLTIAVGVLIAL